MNSPTISLPSFDCETVSKISTLICEVCGLKAHGKHYGVTTCRACAAFFRRHGVSGIAFPCVCSASLGKMWTHCKRCRFRQCKKVGMTINKFQYDRDPYQDRKDKRRIEALIPPTMDTFLGKPNFIVYCEPDQYSDKTPKVIIDVQYLINKAEEVLVKGPATPIFAFNPLEKLALGLQQSRSRMKPGTKVVRKIGKEEVFAAIEDDLLKVAYWLTYFDEFQLLPSQIQFDLLKGIWRVWTRLDKLATTTVGRRQRLCEKKQMMVLTNDDRVLCEFDKIEIDISWQTKYTRKQLEFFDSGNGDARFEEMIQLMLDLKPTDVELAFMMCQLSFQYVGKRYQGQILEITDRFQETVSNHLHDYYINDVSMPQYSMRMAQMMKINNQIQMEMRHERSKQELCKVFDIFYAEFSHSEIFSEL